MVPKISLFLSSYIPLFVVFGITQCQSIGAWAWTPCGFSVSALLMVIAWMRFSRSKAKETMQVMKAKSKDSEVIAYLFSYVLPMAGLKWSDPGGKASLIVFFIMISVLYINSNLLYINPTLNCFGYHVLDIELSTSNDIILITKKNRISHGSSLYAHRITNGIYLEAQS